MIQSTFSPAMCAAVRQLAELFMHPSPKTSGEAAQVDSRWNVWVDLSRAHYDAHPEERRPLALGTGWPVV